MNNNKYTTNYIHKYLNFWGQSNIQCFPCKITSTIVESPQMGGYFTVETSNIYIE